MKTKKGNIKMVPPDGGWGWFIVLGSSFINLSTRAIEPSFGLLFGDLLRELGVETTGASLVISTLDSIINFSGLIVGPLIKRLTYRKVAIIGGLLSSSALLLTAPAKSMIHILITFGFIGGIGFGLATACTLVGINSYFSKKKGQAVGLAMTGTAVGLMTMPQIVRFLLAEYDFRSALLILGAISLHAVVGASLFQPVKWHMKPVVVEEEENKDETQSLLGNDKVKRKNSLGPAEATTNGLTHEVPSNSQLDNNRRHSENSQSITRKMSAISHLSLLDDVPVNHIHIENLDEGKNIELHDVTCHKTEESKKKEEENTSWWVKFCKFMDFDLLTDGVYLNILYGVSICIVAEMNFKLIIPFFLMDLGFSKKDIAFALTTMAIADTSARVIIPPILDRLTFSKRATLMFGSISVAFCRSCVGLQTKMLPILCFLVVIGFSRGIAMTNLPLVLTEYATLTNSNFPSVLGLSMVTRGLFIVILGPISGYVRDFTRSFPLYIHFQSLLILSVIISWCIEIYIIKPKLTNKKQSTAEIR